MSILQEPKVVAILQQIAKNENITDAEFEIDNGADKGDGYLSKMTCVKIKSKTTSTQLQILVKCAHRNPEQRTTFPLHQLYLRETRFYEKVMPAFMEYQQIKHVREPFMAVPRYYASCTDESNEFLIMENLKLRGFELWDRKKPLDSVHTKLLLHNYAKFHAISFAMKQDNPKLYSELSLGLDNLFVPKYVDRSFFESHDMGIDKAITLFSSNGSDAKYRNRLQDFKNADKSIKFFNMTDQSDWEHPIITHGDSWLNNFMFKYNSKKELEEAKFVDFQIMRHVSPILDIAYAVYMNADASVYNNYEHYMKLYYDHLISQGNEMGTDITKLMSYAELKQEWAKYSVYGFLFGLIGVGILLQDKDNVVDLSDLATGQVSAANVFFVNNDSPEAVRRTRNLVIHFVDNNFI